MPDNVRFVWQSIGTHGGVSARVVSQPAPGADNLGTGVMIRDGTQPGAAEYSFYPTTGHVLAVRVRPAQNAGESFAAKVPGDAPAYLRVARSGDTFTAFTSRDGRAWHVVPNSGVTIHMATSVEAGVAVALGQPSVATIDSAAVANHDLGDGCPSGWRCGQLGDPNVTGSQEASGGAWTVAGAGAMPDNVRFIWQSIGTHGGVSARVVSQPAPGADNLGTGVMIRDGTQPGAAEYSFYPTTGHVLAVRVRPAQNAGESFAAKVPGDAPAYLRVARSGDTFTAFTSRDGRAWHVVPNSGVTIHMGRRVDTGIVVALGQLGTAMIKGAIVANHDLGDGCPSGWRCGQLGDPNVTGSQEASGGAWTVAGAGAMPDNVRFIWQSIGTHGGVSARVVSQPAPGADNLGTGVMIRDGTQPGAAEYSFYPTTGHVLAVRVRPAQNAGESFAAKVPGDAPAYLRVARSGDTFTAFTSRDGRAWHVVPNSGVTIHMATSVEAGVAVALGQQGTAIVDNVSSSGVSSTGGEPSAPLASQGSQVILANWDAPDNNFEQPIGGILNLQASLQIGSENYYRHGYNLPTVVRFSISWRSNKEYVICSVPRRDALIEDTTVVNGKRLNGAVTGVYTCRNAHIPRKAPIGPARLSFSVPGMSVLAEPLQGVLVSSLVAGPPLSACKNIAQQTAITAPPVEALPIPLSSTPWDSTEFLYGANLSGSRCKNAVLNTEYDKAGLIKKVSLASPQGVSVSVDKYGDIFGKVKVGKGPVQVETKFDTESFYVGAVVTATAGASPFILKVEQREGIRCKLGVVPSVGLRLLAVAIAIYTFLTTPIPSFGPAARYAVAEQVARHFNIPQGPAYQSAQSFHILARQAAPTQNTINDLKTLLDPRLVQDATAVTALRVVPTQTQAGQTIAFTGFGFIPNSKVSVFLGRPSSIPKSRLITSAVEIRAGDHGGIAGRIRLPTTATTGRWLLVAFDVQRASDSLVSFANGQSKSVTLFLSVQSITVGKR